MGERYRREKSIYDNHWQDHKWHLECSKDSARVFREEHEEEFDPMSHDRPTERLGFSD